MPETSEKILAQLNAKKRELSDMHTFGLYESGNKVTDQPEILFARQDVKEVLEKVEAKKAAAKAAAGETEEAKEEEPVIDIPKKEEITFEDFEKMQFQVGEIISCEAVKKSKKLLCSQVKIGSEVKQIVVRYQGSLFTGRDGRQEGNGSCKPQTRQTGRRSFRGMILCAEDENGELALMVPEKKMPAGAEVC